MLNVIYVVVLIATTAILVHMTISARQARNVFLKWAGVTIGVVLMAIFAATAAVISAFFARRIRFMFQEISKLRMAQRPRKHMKDATAGILLACMFVAVVVLGLGVLAFAAAPLADPNGIGLPP